MGDVRYIFITGGVISSLGKGLFTASLGALLKSNSLSISLLKMDPYLNVDPGTMNPYQHGEVFVTADGMETDLDLGHYERFCDMELSAMSSITAGQIYNEVLNNERSGSYEGATVQVIPHITDEIKRRIHLLGEHAELVLVEVGGTVGDIESQPFLEAVRQMKRELPAEHTIVAHLTYIPDLVTAGEFKTKPTQHSVRELRSAGLKPDILVCRSQREMPESSREKISEFCDVSISNIYNLPDLDSIYSCPLVLAEQGISNNVMRLLGLEEAKTLHLEPWQNFQQKIMHANSKLNILMVGKYTDLSDAYKSLVEAIINAGYSQGTKVNLQFLEATKLEIEDAEALDLLTNADAVVVPGGFGKRGVQGMLKAVKHCRESKTPYFGICFGMHIAIIESVRSQLGVDCDSTEVDPNTKIPIIDQISKWKDTKGVIKYYSEDRGGSMRLGTYEALVEPNSKLAQIYGAQIVEERHRHRYDVNNEYLSLLEQSGLKIAAVSKNENLVEAIELEDHPWFIACQFHPEFSARPIQGHPFFNDFIQAVLQHKAKPQQYILNQAANS